MNTGSALPSAASFQSLADLFARHAMPAATLILAILVLPAPLTHGDAGARIGFLLSVSALLEMTHGFRRAAYNDQKSAWISGAISLGLGTLLMNAPLFATEALRLFLAGWFGLDALRNLVTAVRGENQDRFRSRDLFYAVANVVIAGTVLQLDQQWLIWAIALAASFRILCNAATMARARLLTTDMLSEPGSLTEGLPSHPRVQLAADEIVRQELARTSIDRNWIISFLLTLLAIHVGRMGFDRTFLGLMSPGFAVIGDMFAGLLIAFLLVIPAIVVSTRLTRQLENLAWTWCLQPSSGVLPWLKAPLQSLLTFRLRQVIRLRHARCSYVTAFSRGLQIGLPLAAIIAATAPMWGMSWYFDTENWAAGIWNSWAEHRTDAWREAMVTAVSKEMPLETAETAFAVTPDGVQSDSDFAFIVIGDPGEGDASQLSLKSQLLKIADREDIRFVVISSDVVYPTGAMKDYESCFWLPFMGVTKPVYAIPGNHDWYDALEGFAATFFKPEAARAAMRARVETDARISSTTETRIEELIAKASEFQRQYHVPVQLQQAPYFQLQTDDFALFAVDTGVAKRIDPVQYEWLEAGLNAAHGKNIMVILGHPFFAGGADLTVQDDLLAAQTDFAQLRSLLRKHNVSIVMAGDTHDLEYYREDSVESPPVHHFVNGGGGAYLSFGTSLDWPEKPVTSHWAFFPNRQQVVQKIDATTPIWKRPAWLWTRYLGGWPFSAEFLSAAFDSNTAPFYQSFMEVRVEPSKQQIRLIPYGVHGQLRYSDLQQSTDSLKSNENAGVEWTIPMLQSR